MRVLGVSDIHGNVRAVEKLRSLERNDFDLVIVAGDIGNDAAEVIFGILSSFGCPVLYVFGNWDGRLAYDRPFGPDCHHLHMNPFEHGGFSFVGFSGLPTKWGQNPHALRLKSEVRSKHQAVLNDLAALDAEYDVASSRIRAEYHSHIAELNARGLKTRGRAYQNRLDELDRWRRDQLKEASAERDKRLKSAEYTSYRKDDNATYPEILRSNRRDLSRLVNDTGPERSIVVTHERLTKTHEDLVGVPLFLYGHRHGFEDKTYKGARFVNVSALENCVTVMPINPQSVDWDFRNINAGGYVILDIDASDIRTSPKYLPVNMKGVVRAEDWRLISRPVDD